MAWEAWFTLGVVIVLIIGLVRAWTTPDWLTLGALTALMLVSAISGSSNLPKAGDAVAGLGNAGLVTVAALFIVAAGLVQTGAMEFITRYLIGQPRSLLGAQLRLLLPAMGLSAFMNNTPVVAMFLPVADDVCKRARLSPSKLFLPLAYAATFGGVCTLIGTSTNLVVNGLMIQRDLTPLRMFDITWLGLPAALAGIGYVLLTSRWLLPDRRAAIGFDDDPRQYTVEMMVQPGGPLEGLSVEKAGLRQLPGLYLVEIDREGEVLQAVGPDQRLLGGDRLIFAGIVESVVDLQRIRGLAPATDQMFKLNAPRAQRCLIEAVVSNRCPLIGKSIREGRFRTVYNAAVIAVARSGKRIEGKIGDIVLQAGDTLLVEAHEEFARRQRNSSDFFLVSGIENSAPRRHDLAPIALAILAAMVAAATFNLLDMLPAAMAAAGLMVLTRCCTGMEARRSIEWSVLVVIAASLGIGRAIETTGTARVLAEGIIGLASDNPWLVLLAIYFVTALCTEIITNNAAAVLVFPIALAAAESLNVSYMPFVVTIMVAASASFSTPIGYQTNLMVYGPGGYRFTDYLRIGIPLNLIFMLITVTLAPLIWPFVSRS